MKKCLIIALVLGSISPSFAFDTSGCGHFEVGAEALWLRPTGCGTDFCVADPRAYPNTVSASQNRIDQADRLPVGSEHCVDPTYGLGFRVGLGYVTPDFCHDVWIQYTHLNVSNDAICRPRPAAGGLWPTRGQPLYSSTALYNPITNGSVPNQIAAVFTARARSDYDAVDIQLGSWSMSRCRLWMRKFIGLRWADIEQVFGANYRGTVDPGASQTAPQVEATNFLLNVEQKATTWGLGPRVGFDARVSVACGFGIGAQFGASLIAGERDGRFKERAFVQTAVVTPVTLVDQLSDVRYCSRLQIVPELDARLGLNYETHCGCVALQLELGYEFTTYINTVSRPTFDQSESVIVLGPLFPGGGASAHQNDNCYSFNLAGVYFMAMAVF